MKSRQAQKLQCFFFYFRAKAFVLSVHNSIYPGIFFFIIHFPLTETCVNLPWAVKRWNVLPMFICRRYLQYSRFVRWSGASATWSMFAPLSISATHKERVFRIRFCNFVFIFFFRRTERDIHIVTKTSCAKKEYPLFSVCGFKEIRDDGIVTDAGWGHRAENARKRNRRKT